MKISLVAAIAQNNAIGKDNGLLWHLPADFKHFKETTTGHYILMGRKTFESFPKPLPDRVHLIITRRSDMVVPENCFTFSSVESALKFAENNQQKIVYVIGGGEIYRQTIRSSDELILTHVAASFDNADAFFPEIDREWKIVSEKSFQADDKNKYDFTITVYHR